MSRFARKLAGDGFVLTLEITPPRDWRPRVLARRASGLGGLPDAVDVIQRGGRLPSLAASRWLARQGFEPVWHLASHGRSRQRVVAEIERAASAGLRLVLCLRGDDPGPPSRQRMLVRESVAEVRSRLPRALVGVTFDPYARPERGLRWLGPKLEAGARFVQTQPVFAPEVLTPVADEITRCDPAIGLLPMVMPVLSLEAARRIERRLGIPLPGDWVEALRRGGAAAGWRLFQANLDRLRHDGRVAGVTIMTFEMDPPRAVLERLAQTLDAKAANATQRRAGAC
jgi:homocysteine S-methyltransferase